jgi:glucose/arabinose dehydrogenase
MIKKLLVISSLSLLPALGKSQLSVDLIQVASGLPDIVDIAHAGDDRIFCVLQSGTVRIVQDGVVLPTPFLTVTVSFSGEQGLLGLTFDPNYAQNGFLYVHYTINSGGLKSRVARYRVSDADPNVADPASAIILFEWPQPYGNHNGGEIDFGPDGYLYIGLGDGGSGGDPQNNAQDLSDPLGDIMRIAITEDGTGYTIPPDNPYADATSPDTMPEIFASGLRNPWRFGFDALTGDLWIGDVGQNAWEEVDFWPAGDMYTSGPNFGWRCYEGLVPYNTDGCVQADQYVQPIAVQPNGPWCSVIGGRVYRGSEFPTLYGHYLYTDYCVGGIWSLTPDGAGGWVNDQLMDNQGLGFTVIAEDVNNELYVGHTDDGILYRLVDPMTVNIADRNEIPVNIYPVPASDRFTVEGDLQNVRNLQLIDAAGRIATEFPLNSTQFRIDVPTGSLTDGVYMLRLLDDRGNVAARRMISVVH